MIQYFCDACEAQVPELTYRRNRLYVNDVSYNICADCMNEVKALLQGRQGTITLNAPRDTNVSSE